MKTIVSPKDQNTIIPEYVEGGMIITKNITKGMPDRFFRLSWDNYKQGYRWVCK